MSATFDKHLPTETWQDVIRRLHAPVPSRTWTDGTYGASFPFAGAHPTGNVCREDYKH